MYSTIYDDDVIRGVWPIVMKFSTKVVSDNGRYK